MSDTSRSGHVRRRNALAGGLAIVLAAALVATVLLTNRGRGSGAPEVMAGNHSCLLAGHPRPGSQMFAVDNVGSIATEVDVLGSGATAALEFGEIEDVGPGTTASMPVDVGPGTFTVVCEPGRNDDNPATSEFVVTGSGPPGTGIPETNDVEFQAPIHAYKLYVGAQLAALSHGLVGLRAMVAQGNLTGAEADYPIVHANYERIGAVYDAFGAANTAINGLADGLPLGEADPSFTGFHKLEAQMWGAAPTAAMLSTIDVLATNVAQLQATLPQVDIDSLTYATRAHEILENALQEQVTGLTEPYSHTGIDDTAASTTGAEEVLSTLRPLIDQEDAALLPQIDAGFVRLNGVLASLQTTGPGNYLPDTALSIGQREQLTAALGSLLEVLAHVPGLITPPQEPRESPNAD